MRFKTYSQNRRLKTSKKREEKSGKVGNKPEKKVRERMREKTEFDQWTFSCVKYKWYLFLWTEVYVSV